MAQNITLMGVSYTDVPAVELPKTGGGTAIFYDVADGDALGYGGSYVVGTAEVGTAIVGAASALVGAEVVGTAQI